MFIELYPPQAESFQSSLPLSFTTLLHPLTCFYDPADFLYPIYPYSPNCNLHPTTPSDGSPATAYPLFAKRSALQFLSSPLPLPSPTTAVDFICPLYPYSDVYTKVQKTARKPFTIRNSLFDTCPESYRGIEYSPYPPSSVLRLRGTGHESRATSHKYRALSARGGIENPYLAPHPSPPIPVLTCTTTTIISTTSLQPIPLLLWH